MVGAPEQALVHQRIEQLGLGKLTKEVCLTGYGAIRNFGLVIANVLGFDSVVFLDDDEIVEDPAFLRKAMYGLGKYQGKGRFNPTVLSMRAAQLLTERRVKLVGIDAPTVENMELCDGEVHRLLLGSGIAVLEGLCLQDATEEHYLLSALPLRLVGENGAPCRAVLYRED